MVKIRENIEKFTKIIIEKSTKEKSKNFYFQNINYLPCMLQTDDIDTLVEPKDHSHNKMVGEVIDTLT